MTLRALLVGLFAAAALPAQARVLARVEHAPIYDQVVADTDGDGRDELLLARRSSHPDGAALLRFALDGEALRADGAIRFDDPAHTLLALGDLLPRPGVELIAATPARTAVLPWPTADDDAPEPIALSRRARFTVRVDEPQLSSFVLDLNQDGRLDLMLPGLDGVQPYLQEAPDERGEPTFRRMATVTVPVSTGVGTGSGGLDPELTGSVTIPHIRTLDLNGDDRPDLITRADKVHAFHLQRSDGSFAPPIEVDLRQFVDSTPKAVVDFGRTAVLSDEQLLQRGDVDGDGVPDYVIAHRRKIWTFRADAGGPQFKKARAQAVAEDVSAMLLLDLDQDGRADLLTFRVQLPGIGALILGLVQSIDIDVRVVGYQSEGDGFAPKPRWRRTITVRIPPLLTLLGQQEELIERFTGILGKARMSARGDFDGDDTDDLAVVLADGSAVELYVGVPPPPRLDSAAGGRLVNELVFDSDDPVFDVDRIFGILSGFLAEIGERMVGDRQVVATVPLRDPADWLLIDLRSADMDGRDGAELILCYQAPDDPLRRAYDVVTWR